MITLIFYKMKKQLFKIFLAGLFFIFPLFAGAQQEIKVMSYNIRLDVASDGENRWDARKDKVAALMNYYEADFIGGQEVGDFEARIFVDSAPVLEKAWAQKSGLGWQHIVF